MIPDLNYSQFKNHALQNQPVSLRVSLSEIEIINGDTMFIRGSEVKMTKGALSNLANILKLPKTFIGEFEKLTSEQGKDKFINFIKNAKVAVKDVLVTLVGSPRTKKIIGVLESDFLPYEMYFKTLEDIMNKDAFEIKDMIFDQQKLQVNAVLKSGKFNVGNFDNELFFPGISMMYDVTSGTVMESYLQRLICSNGMTARFNPKGDGGPIVFNGGDSSDFFRRVDALQETGFIPAGFHETVNRAINTDASYNEVKYAANLIKGSAENIDKNFLDKFLPLTYSETELKKGGLILASMTPQQEKSIKTNISVWDTINAITDFASHDYGISVNPGARASLQHKAAQILERPVFDTENVLNFKIK